MGTTADDVNGVDMKFEADVRLDSIYESRSGVDEGNASSRTNGSTESVAGVRPSGVELVHNPIPARPR